MADLVLPPVQLSAFAWDNIAQHLRASGDVHLRACAEEIARQMAGYRECAQESGRVRFAIQVFTGD